jgi:hypothetical protein
MKPRGEDYQQIQKRIDVEDLSTLTKKHLEQICSNSIDEADRISKSGTNSEYDPDDSPMQGSRKKGSQLRSEPDSGLKENSSKIDDRYGIEYR